MEKVTEINMAQFTDKLMKALGDFYGKDYNIYINEVIKNNGLRLHGITIMKQGESIAPSIYIDGLLEEYNRGMTFADIVRNIIHIREQKEVKGAPDVSFFTDYERVRSRLGIRLINEEMNEELLKEVPYRKYLDMAIIAEVVVNDDTIGNGSIVIRNQHLAGWNVDEETLIDDAIANMQKVNPPYLKGLLELLREIYISDMGNIDNEDVIEALMGPALENMEQIRNESCQMYVLTNTGKYHGAASIVYPEILGKLAEEVGGDYYLLPSSIHEVIILPASGRELDGDNLSAMVRDVNCQHLIREEILSNNAYRYSQRDAVLNRL